MEHLKLIVHDLLQEYAPKLSQEIIVGASGGKDSMLLCHLLRDLGYEVVPVIVDMGYTNFQSKLISDELKHHGFDPQIVHVSELIEDENLDPETRLELGASFLELKDLGNKTPCTACSKNKRVSLKTYALRRNISAVAYGHHLTDLNVTLLKDYYLYKYNNLIGEYSTENFDQFIKKTSIDTAEISTLIDEGHVSTMNIVYMLNKDIVALRPMAFLSELDIIECNNRLGLRNFGSGCSHDIFLTGDPSLMSKREVVHDNYKMLLLKNPLLDTYLKPLVMKCLDANGNVKTNPRANRSTRLSNL
jgi:tRNA(Ile)-lysidine synthase TilS/MesJ